MKTKTISLITLISILFILAIPSFALSEGIKWQSYDKGTAIAKEQGKKIFLYFHGNPNDPGNAIPKGKTRESNLFFQLGADRKVCKLMEGSTFKDSSVIHYLNDNFVSISIDIYGSIKEWKLADSFRVNEFPTMVFFKKDYTKQILSLDRSTDANGFMDALKFIKTESYEKMSFQAYYDRGLAYQKPRNREEYSDEEVTRRNLEKKMRKLVQKNAIIGLWCCRRPVTHPNVWQSM